MLSLFHPSPSVWGLVRAIVPEVDLVVLVDDSGASALVVPDEPLLEGCRLLANPTNMGLAHALNRGCSAALDDGADVIITLDQDATLPPGFVRRAVELLDRRRQEDASVAAVAPQSVNGIPHQHRHRHGDHECSLWVVQSGLTIGADALRTVGRFREDFVIDALEVDFVMRLHRAGLHVVLEEDLALEHAIGDPRTGQLLGLGFRASNHSARRVYSIARNNAYLASRNVLREPRWSLAAFWGLAKRTLKILLREDERAAKVAQLGRGLRDGLLGRLGPVD